MSRRRRFRPKRGTYLSILVLVLLLVTIVGLIFYARWQTHSPDRAKLATTLLELQQRSVDAKNAVLKAREGLPPGSPLAPPWDCRSALSQGGSTENQLFTVMARMFVDSNGALPAEKIDTLRSQLAILRANKQLTPFMQSVDPETNTPEQILVHVREALCASDELQKLEEGLACGLCADVAVYDERGQTMGVKAVSLAARAVAEAQAGNPTKAVDTCLAAYRLVELATRGRLLNGVAEASETNMLTDRAVWAIADATTLPAADQERLLAEIDKRRSTTDMADACRFSAARMETGQSWQRERHDFFFRFFMGRSTRGTAKIAERFIPLLGEPPYKTKNQIDDIRNTFTGNRGNDHPFVWTAVGAYLRHADDVSRAEAAHVGFALKNWKRDHGAYPAALSELAPKPLENELLDPNTGQPAQYEVTPEGGFKITVPYDPGLYRTYGGMGPRQRKANVTGPDGQPKTCLVLWEARN